MQVPFKKMHNSIVNPLRMQGHTIMVTGASSGIGRATAILLSQLGAKPILVARRRENLETTASLLNGECYVEPFDLSDVEAIPVWLSGMTSRTGVLSGLVHAAGVQSPRPLRYWDVQDAEKVFRINTMAAMSLSKGFCQKSCNGGSGSIVFVASVMGLVGQPALVNYSAAKGALISMSKSLAIELARHRVRVNCVAPSLVQTEIAESLRRSLTSEQFASIEGMHPLGLGEVQDVAYAIAFLLADTARWITGTTLVVDGGYSAH